MSSFPLYFMRHSRDYSSLTYHSTKRDMSRPRHVSLRGSSVEAVSNCNCNCFFCLYCLYLFMC